MYTNKKDFTSTSVARVVSVSRDLINEAHRYILHNSDEVQPYITQHIDCLCQMNPAKSKREKWVLDQHNKLSVLGFDIELILNYHVQVT